VEIFWLRSCEAPWGDYGQILLNGMSSHLPRIDGRIQFERTGPYIPAVMFPRRGEVIVADALRKAFDNSRYGPLPVRPVDKAKVVRLDWERWVRDEPPVYFPPSGDPEDLILLPEHDADVCSQIGALWEIDPVSIGHGSYTKVQKRPPEFRVTVEVPRALPPLFRADGVPVVLVREDVGEFLLGLTHNDLRLAPVEARFSDS